MKISYAVTVKDELSEIKRLIEFLLKHKRTEDEIVILYDTNGSFGVYDYLDTVDEIVNVHVIKDKFQGHFGDWKNLLTSYCTGDYIFQIDADEYPDEIIILTLPEIFELTGDVDIMLVPRINTVEGLTEAHITKWGWTVTKLEIPSLLREKEIDTLSEEYRFLKKGGFILEETVTG